MRELACGSICRLHFTPLFTRWESFDAASLHSSLPHLFYTPVGVAWSHLFLTKVQRDNRQRDFKGKAPLVHEGGEHTKGEDSKGRTHFTSLHSTSLDNNNNRQQHCLYEQEQERTRINI
eukprot:GHVS01003054.1.p1 GENE.GHVS01003054.1~~GHVS01003054.1.p1  ORF type:complete len:119 (-),score=33.04 GHVS01003054.1:63-419(-)